MFPTFVTSFQDQFLAMLINVLGTVVGGFMTTLFNTVGNGFFVPLLQALAKALTTPPA